MLNKLNNKERLHLARIKEMPCSVCGEPPVSEAHHIEQGSQYLCIPLCPSCHRSSFNGIHGEARIWKVKKMSEMDALNDTIKRLLEG
jgi:hypothetical protein